MYGQTDSATSDSGTSHFPWLHVYLIFDLGSLARTPQVDVFITAVECILNLNVAFGSSMHLHLSSQNSGGHFRLAFENLSLHLLMITLSDNVKRDLQVHTLSFPFDPNNVYWVLTSHDLSKSPFLVGDRLLGVDIGAKLGGSLEYVDGGLLPYVDGYAVCGDSFLEAEHDIGSLTGLRSHVGLEFNLSKYANLAGIS